MISWLRDFRVRAKMSQNDVAKKVGITPQMYNYIENGKRGVTIENAKKIGSVLGFEWTKFYEEEKGG